MQKLFQLPRAAALILFVTLAATAPAPAEQVDSPVVDVVAVHEHDTDRHLFRISERELDSGWTTFRFTNASPVDHFFLIWQYPAEGVAAAQDAGESLLEHWFGNVASAFEGFDEYLAGKMTLDEYSHQVIASLQANAPWFFDPGATPTGGPGFTAPGAINHTSVFLEPGEYIVECYVRDENGVFHTVAGMLDHLSVSENTSGASAPSATAQISISSAHGISIDIPPVAGRNVIKVHYQDQAVYPHFLGHNVQLARIRDKTDAGALAAIAQWMDWRHLEGLVNRAPAGARFIGGVMEMAAGMSGDFWH